MATSLASLKKSSPPKDPLVLLYGVEGVGKDTLASEFPSPVLIKTPDEHPPAGVEIDEFPVVDSFATLMDHIEALFVEDHSFKTLIISAIDGVETMVWAETCKRNGWQTIEDQDYGKGYLAADEVWNELFEALRALRQDKGMTIVMLGHCEIKQFDDPAVGSYARYWPNLHKRASATIREACDIIGFLNFRTSITEEKGDFGAKKTKTGGAGQRFIHLEERPGFIAKNRYNMPASIGPLQKGKGWAEIAKHLPATA